MGGADVTPRNNYRALVVVLLDWYGPPATERGEGTCIILEIVKCTNFPWLDKESLTRPSTQYASNNISNIRNILCYIH